MAECLIKHMEELKLASDEVLGKTQEIETNIYKVVKGSFYEWSQFIFLIWKKIT